MQKEFLNFNIYEILYRQNRIIYIEEEVLVDKNIY